MSKSEGLQYTVTASMQGKKGKHSRLRKVYKGFNKLHDITSVVNDQTIAIVSVQGKTDLWRLENTVAALEELKRYYRDDGWREFSILLCTPTHRVRGA